METNKSNMAIPIGRDAFDGFIKSVEFRRSGK
jgi:hypothetical protein